MGVWSIIKLAFHSLNGNKTRTLLTIIVLSVVSFVVVLLGGIGYSFYLSVDRNIGEVFRTTPTVMDINAEYEYQSSDSMGDIQVSSRFTPSQIETILNILDNDDGYITSVSFFDASSPYPYSNYAYMNTDDNNSYYGQDFRVFPFYARSNPFTGLVNDGSTFIKRDADNYLESGRMWNSSDEGTINIWLSASEMDNYSLDGQITLCLNSYNRYTGVSTTTRVITATIRGFLNVGSGQGERYAFLDYTNFNDERGSLNDEEWFGGYADKMVIESVYATMIPQPEFGYGTETQKYFKDLIKQVNASVTPTESGAKMATECNTLGMLTLTTILSLVVIGFAALISLIIILLSIGSVANTIKISAEQNRKFFGMMKAIGMKNGHLRKILIWQIIIMTVLGVGLASLGAYLLIGVMNSLLGTLIGGLFFMLEEVIIICSINPLIPVGVVALLTGFVLLFTRANMHAISRMDVITVINEVN